jgi:WD40 repeat protein
MLIKFRSALLVVIGITILCLEPASSQVVEKQKKIDQPKDPNVLANTEDKIITIGEDKLPPGAIARLGSTWLRHGHEISSLTFSPDGKTLFSTASDFFTREWNAETGKPLRAFGDVKTEILINPYGPTRWAQSVVVSPDGTFLAVAYQSNLIRIWNLKTGKLMNELPVQVPIRQLTISSDGKRVAFHSYRDHVQVWDRENGAITSSANCGVGDIVTIGFVGKEKFLWIHSNDGRCALLDSSKANLDKKLHELKDNSSVCVCNQSDTVIWGDKRGTIHVYDPFKEKEIRKFEGARDAIASLALSADGKHVAAATSEEIRVFETETGKRVGRILETPHGIGTLAVSVGGKRVASMKDQRSLVFRKDQNTITLWDVEKGESIDPSIGHRGLIRSVCFDADSKMLWTSGSDQKIRKWDVSKGKLLKQIEPDHAASDAISFSQDRSRMVYGNRKGEVVVVDVKSGEEIRKIELGDKPLISAASSPKEEWFAGLNKEGTLILWNTTQKRIWVREELKDVSNGVHLRFSRNEKTLLAFSAGKSVRLYDIDTGKWREIAEDPGKVYSAAFSSDGEWIALGDDDGKARIKEVATGKVLHTFEGHPGYVIGIGFSADNKFLAVGSWRTLTVWEIASEKELKRFNDITGDVHCLDISPNGQIVATGNGDGTILLWDLTNSTGKEKTK